MSEYAEGVPIGIGEPVPELEAQKVARLRGNTTTTNLDCEGSAEVGWAHQWTGNYDR